jgi:hypothetical protein
MQLRDSEDTVKLGVMQPVGMAEHLTHALQAADISKRCDMDHFSCAIEHVR